MNDQIAAITRYQPGQKVTKKITQKIVLVGGCFDILHFGHIEFLQRAKEHGDFLIVALEPDEKISAYKHRNPTHTHYERAHNLLALRSVDHVLLLPTLKTFDDYCTLVQTIQPDIIAITEDDPQQENKKQQAAHAGAHVVIVTERISDFSSSLIYNKIKND